MQKAQISVIIPCYKRIEQTLRTIQLLRDSNGFGEVFDVELIVTDSTPDTSLHDALKEQFHDAVRYVRPKVPGISTGKNAGAHAATHPILVFCDSDIEVEPDVLEKTVSTLRDNPRGAAVTGQVVWRGGDRDGKHDRPRSEDRKKEVNGTVYIEAIYSRFIATYTDIFHLVGGYDETVFAMRGEGSDLSTRYWRAGYPLLYDPSIVVHHITDAEESIAIRIKHAEWGIAKDLMLLMYKYDMMEDEYDNFARTVGANFERLGKKSYFRIIQGIVHNIDMIYESLGKIRKQTPKTQPLYDFKFLEIFTDDKLFQDCVGEANKRVEASYRKAFGA